MIRDTVGPLAVQSATGNSVEIAHEGRIRVNNKDNAVVDISSGHTVEKLKEKTEIDLFKRHNFCFFHYHLVTCF